jgi:hypothetical protein
MAIAIGKFYQVERPGYEDNFSAIVPLHDDRDSLLADLLAKFI